MLGEYNINYNGNGGIHSETKEKSWIDIENKVKIGVTYDISLKSLGNKGFKKTGYKLLGWNSSFIASEPLNFYTVSENKNPTLFAVWKLDKPETNIKIFSNNQWKTGIIYIYKNNKWNPCFSKVYIAKNY